MEQAERVWDGSKEEQEQDRKERVVMNKKKYGPDYWDKELTEDEMSPSVRKVYRKLKSMYRQPPPNSVPQQERLLKKTEVDFDLITKK